VSIRPSTAPARERGLHELVRTRSRLTPHQSPKHSLGCGPRTTRRPAPPSTFPRRTAPDFPFAALLRESRDSHLRAPRTRTVLRTAVGAPRWPQASAWEAGRPQRGARGRPPRLDVSRTGQPIHQTAEVANLAGPLNERHWCEHSLFSALRLTGTSVEPVTVRVERRPPRVCGYFVHKAPLLDDEASFASGPPAGLRAQGPKAWRRCDEWSGARGAALGPMPDARS